MPSEELVKEIEEAAEQVSAEHEQELAEAREDGEQKVAFGGVEVEYKEGFNHLDESQQEADDTGEEDSEADDTATESDSKEDDDTEASEDTEGETERQEDLPATPDLSDEVLARAIKAGMSLGDALTFPNEAALDRVVSAVENAAKPADQKRDEDDTDPFAALKLDPEKFEPEVVEMFDSMRKALQSQQEQIQEFRQQQEHIVQSGQMAAAREVEQWFDGQVESLGEDFVDALGTGGHSSLDRGSPQYAKREQIAEHMSVLLAGYQAQGQNAPPREDVFNMAARFVLADKYQEVHEKRLAGDLAKRKGAHLQRVNRSKS